jgi:hypothetical protein
MQPGCIRMSSVTVQKFFYHQTCKGRIKRVTLHIAAEKRNEFIRVILFKREAKHCPPSYNASEFPRLGSLKFPKLSLPFLFLSVLVTLT